MVVFSDYTLDMLKLQNCNIVMKRYRMGAT